MPGDGCGALRNAARLLDFAQRNHAGPQQRDLSANKRDHGRLNSDLVGPAIEHLHRIAERFANMLGRGRRKSREAVRAGRGDGHARASINCKRQGMRGMRTPTVGKPAVTMSGICGRFREHQRQRPRPIAPAPAPRLAAAIPSRSLRAISMDATCTISGLVGGRPFSSKIFATAAASSAFAPRP